MRVFKITLFFLVTALNFIQAQKTIQLKGQLADADKTPLVAATVVLLQAADSSIVSYALTDDKGRFRLDAKKEESYLLQMSYMGYVTQNKLVIIKEDTDLGLLTMQEATNELESVQVEAEYIPLRVRGDTLEFNSAAFNVQAHDDVEKLLEQLPGVEIDKDGNVTVNGKKVEKILVDGKEFFGHDVKLALKNLPADAIEKIDVFNKNKEEESQSDAAEGETKTLNLTLKEDKKVGFMGNVTAGYGYPNHRYKGALSLNYFNPKMRISTIGAINNVNEAGFSYKDYQDMAGGSIRFMNNNPAMSIGSNWDDPIVSLMWGGATGETRGITGGLNANFFLTEYTDLSIHYIYTNARRYNLSKSYTRSLTPENFYTRNSVNQNLLMAQRHNVNMAFKHKIDSTHEFKFNTNIRLNNSNNTADNNSETLGSNDTIQNSLLQDNFNDISAGGFRSNLYYKHNFKKKERVFSANVAAAYLDKINEFSNLSRTDLFDDGIFTNTDSLHQIQMLLYNKQVYGTELFYKEPLGKYNELIIRIQGGLSIEYNDRSVQDIFGQTEVLNDTMSDIYYKYYNFQVFNVGFNRKTDKYTFNSSISFQRSQLVGVLQSIEDNISRDYYYPLGRLRFNYKITKTKSFNIGYRSYLNEPSLNDLQPLVNNQNPLALYIGNMELNPSYNHSLWAGYNFWDPASFTSVYINASASVRQNVIVRTTTIDENFRTIYKPENLGTSYGTSVYGGLSGEIKKIIKYTMRLSANFSSSPMQTNGTDYNRYNHNYSLYLRLQNKKKKFVDLSASAQFRINNAINELNDALNTTFVSHSYTAKCRVTIAKKWNIKTDFSINMYDDLGFENATAVPIWSASIDRTFFKNEALKITFSVENILNEAFQISRYNWSGVLSENQQNMLGRYFMLAATYKINKMGSKPQPQTQDYIMF